MTKELSQRTERDPMGSGTTGVACARLGRRFVGAELKRSYWELARRNLEQASKEQIDLFSEAV